MSSRIDQTEFILEWLKFHTEISCVAEHFHEEFFKKFKGRRKKTNFGAQPVFKAMNLLRQLAFCGMIDRSRISLGINWEPGFPRSVISYTLPSQKAKSEE